MSLISSFRFAFSKHSWFRVAVLTALAVLPHNVAVAQTTIFSEGFTAGEYEDAVAMNSGWAEGDWNADGDFTSADIVSAFSDGGYEIGPRVAVRAVPEPTSLLTALIGITIALTAQTRQRK